MEHLSIESNPQVTEREYASLMTKMTQKNSNC